MVLAHELNDFTMKEAMKFYPPLKAVFKVRLHLLCVRYCKIENISGYKAYRSRRRCSEYFQPISGIQIYYANV